MKKLLILFLGLLTLSVLGYFCIYRKHAPGIQKTLSLNVQKNLSAAEFNAVEARVDGRDVVLQGRVANESLKRKAQELVKVPGYRLVDNQLKVSEVRQPKTLLIVLREGGKLVLGGVVAGTRQHHDLVSAAMGRYGIQNVTDRLTEDADAPAAWGMVARELLQPLSEFRSGSVMLRGDQAMLSGDAFSTQTKQAILSRLQDNDLAFSQIIDRSEVIGGQQDDMQPVTGKKPKPAKADCQQEFDRVMGNKSITFHSAQATLLPESVDLLDEFAKVMKKCDGYIFRVEGHTDSTGDEQQNLVLSKQRVESVVNYLKSLGISEDSLQAEGFGESRPVADNNTAEGRALNRRIEFIVEEKNKQGNAQ